MSMAFSHLSAGLQPIAPQHQGNYMHFSFGVKVFDLGFRYFPHFSVLLLLIPRTLAFLYLTLAYA
jgi:hypothetical protein